MLNCVSWHYGRNKCRIVRPKHNAGFQRFPPFEHLLYGVRTQQVVVDKIQLVGIGTLVALRPFLGIADSTYTAQVDTRHKISRVILLYQVGERQIGSVGMINVTPHDKGECPYPRRPQDVRIRSGLAPRSNVPW